jgi:lysophospholipase L1-like esterase
LVRVPVGVAVQDETNPPRLEPESIMKYAITYQRVHLIAALLAILSSRVDAAEPAKRVLLLGDSITKGVRPGVAKDQTFGAQLESMLKAKGRDVSIVNGGIGSERTDQALARLDEVLKSHRPDIVTLMYGANDSYVDPGKNEPRLPVDRYKKNLLELIERIERAGAKPVLMTSPRWADDARPNGLGENPNIRLEPFAEAVRGLARERKLPLVDHYTAWSEARQQGTVLRKWTTDGLHPNPEGHRVIADQIFRDLEPLLTDRQGSGKTR